MYFLSIDLSRSFTTCRLGLGLGLGLGLAVIVGEAVVVWLLYVAQW